MMLQTPTLQFLADKALEEILERAAPILGEFYIAFIPSRLNFVTGRASSVPPPKTAHWMANVPDETRLVDMNLPGTHDCATWNYSAERQAELEKYTGPLRSHVFFRCQDRSLLDSLDDGIRAFDMRLGYNPGEDTIGFYHGRALLSPTTSFDDVLFGLYHWLVYHPTETILVSIQQEEGSLTTYDEKFEAMLHASLTTPVAQQFWLQTKGRLGTLGEARGKLVLLQRFTYEFLPALGETHEYGIHLGAAKWTPNGADIKLVYSAEPRRVAYIQDNFMPLVPHNSGPDANISAKFAVVTTHLDKAISTSSNATEALYVSFASAHANRDTVPVTPNIIALGDGAGTPGMNERLLPWLTERKGKRFGIVLLDFYHSQPALVQTIIGLSM
ncbi:PLC-like phosphodiesterase [Mycena indigotica]|uniref:PLC-like phosphodiesterase n=1 Tax=Mycena indigotica TaxID=2126181 RepID=A0A8H6S257_9AGAR|nr:PLC-like phosphodiesterase [Mycena indigotica]KAF7291351.1 PLC-like phosphodiesterase [Mycena indigotica]